MGDTKKPYTVSDRRRVGERGQRRQPVIPKGKRLVCFATDLRDPIESAFRYFRAQLEHLPAKADWPRKGDLPSLLRAFVISTQQLFAGAILLIADNRPKTLVLPAGVLARALVEGLGNLFALLEDPSLAIALFRNDDYLHTYRKAVYYRKRFGNRPALLDEERKLTEYGRAMKLTSAECADPERYLKEWPTPGRLLRSRVPPQLTGERRKVFQEVHGFWYSSLSTLSHHRLTALQIAVFTEQQPDEEVFLMAKSMTAGLAVLVALCVLSEVEHTVGADPCTPLRAAWEQARSLDDIAQAVYTCRYARLLGMP